MPGVQTRPPLGLGVQVESSRGPILGEVLWSSALLASSAWVSEEQTQSPTGLPGWGQPPGPLALFWYLLTPLSILSNCFPNLMLEAKM